MEGCSSDVEPASSSGEGAPDGGETLDASRLGRDRTARSSRYSQLQRPLARHTCVQHKHFYYNNVPIKSSKILSTPITPH